MVLQKKKLRENHTVFIRESVKNDVIITLGELEFWVFGGGQNIFNFRGVWPGGGYFLGGGQFIVCLFSHFEMQNFKNSEIFVCGTLIFNIYIFRYRMDVNIDFNTESKFSC